MKSKTQLFNNVYSFFFYLYLLVSVAIFIIFRFNLLHLVDGIKNEIGSIEIILYSCVLSLIHYAIKSKVSALIIKETWCNQRYGPPAISASICTRLQELCFFRKAQSFYAGGQDFNEDDTQGR